MTSANTTEYFCCAGLAIDLLSNLSLPEVPHPLSDSPLSVFQANNSIDTSFTFSLHLNESYGVIQAADTVIILKPMTDYILFQTGVTIGGMIGELDGDTADMAIGGITINPERERIVDFTEPWLYHGIRILEKNVSLQNTE